MTFAPNQSGAIFGVTSGIARDMQAAPEPLAGGDLNGTASTSILFSHAGTAASFLGLPRNLVGSSMGIASPVAIVDFAVDWHPPAADFNPELNPPPESETDALPELVADLPGEAGEAIETPIAAELIEPEPEPEPPHNHKHKHKGRRV